MIKDRKGLLAGLAFLLLGLLTVTVLIPYGIDEPSNVRFAVLSPSYYPRLVSLAMALIGLAILVRAVTVAPSNEDDGPLSPSALAKAGLVMVTLLLTAFALPYAGFILASFGALIVLLLLAGERRPLIIVSVALILPVALHVFFTKVANVPIPEGILSPVLKGW